MNIKVEEWKIKDSSNFKILEVYKCCDKFLKSENITINKEWDELNQEFDYENPNYSVKLKRREHGYENEDYGIFYEAIYFCPFCGEKIMIDIIKVEDKTSEYKLLAEKREMLNNKRRKTDSKKKCNEYDSEIRNLDKKINEMLTSDEGF